MTVFNEHSWLACAAKEATQYRLNTAHGLSAYCGRFAPSPSGVLHQGSLVTALASYVHARWHGGRWLLRIEDVDRSRCTHDYADAQIKLLAALGFVWDAPIVWQSQRFDAYREVFNQLRQKGQVYACQCSRQDIARSTPQKNQFLHAVGDVQRARETPDASASYGNYPRTCALKKHTDSTANIRAWRFNAHDAHPTGLLHWQDARSNAYDGHVDDFVIKRGHAACDDWSYALAVVVDDAHSHITHVVRGEDIIPATGRQIVLQRALGLSTPIYVHVPLVYAACGAKLSKSQQAPALEALSGLDALMHAWIFLGGCAFECASVEDFWAQVLDL